MGQRKLTTCLAVCLFVSTVLFAGSSNMEHNMWMLEFNIFLPRSQQFCACVSTVFCWEFVKESTFCCQQSELFRLNSGSVQQEVGTTDGGSSCAQLRNLAKVARRINKVPVCGQVGSQHTSNRCWDNYASPNGCGDNIPWASWKATGTTPVLLLHGGGVQHTPRGRRESNGPQLWAHPRQHQGGRWIQPTSWIHNTAGCASPTVLPLESGTCNKCISQRVCGTQHGFGLNQRGNPHDAWEGNVAPEGQHHDLLPDQRAQQLPANTRRESNNYCCKDEWDALDLSPTMMWSNGWAWVYMQHLFTCQVWSISQQ